MKMKLQIYILLGFCIYSCGPNNSKQRYSKDQIASLELNESDILTTKINDVLSIDLNSFVEKKSFSLDNSIKDVHLIPLETSDQSLIGNIQKIVFSEKNVFILDDFKGGGIAIFTNRGLFVRRIPNGKGPGELQRLYDIDFDETRGQLIAYEHSFLTFFDSHGEFIREERLPFGFYNFVSTSEGFIFLTFGKEGNEHLGKFKDSKLLITDRNYKVKSSGLKTPDLKCLGTKNYLSKGQNGTILISNKCLDTIYEYSIELNQLKAKLFLDYRNKRVSDYCIFDTYQSFENSMRNNNYCFFGGEYFDTKNHQAIILYNWYENFTSVIYRDKRTGNKVGGSNLKFNLNELPPIFKPIEATKDYFISWYLPSNEDLFATNSTIISEEDKAKVQGLDDNSNPVLVLFKLKEF